MIKLTVFSVLSGILVASVFAGCGNKHLRDVETIYVDPLDAKKVELKDFAQVEFVRLPTDSVTLISGIDGLHISGNRIFILDSGRKKFFIFDSNGNLVKKIADIGHGPNEYISISAFSVDKYNNTFYLFDNNTKKRLRYDFDGNIKEIVKIPFAVKSEDYLDENKSVIVQEVVDSSVEEGLLIHVYNGNMEVEKYLPFRCENGALIYEKYHPVNIHGNCFYYNSMFSNIIYCYDSEYIRENKFKVATWVSFFKSGSKSILFTYGYERKSFYYYFDLYLDKNKYPTG